MTTAAFSGTQTSGNNFSNPTSMATGKSGIPSQDASSIGTGASSTDANPNETDVDLANWGMYLCLP
ncbi:unnamed protein product [Aureobasidium mustum]|uniref:Uncharacterized protein n=1 Tax=Aureobasidium mustum TaxID=2773714 RepID=A0A9N8K4S2_9PEZI|nr:unnamed protein product [Aureobasidium mustum]